MMSKDQRPLRNRGTFPTDGRIKLRLFTTSLDTTSREG
jgi:hypothetical protein